MSGFGGLLIFALLLTGFYVAAFILQAACTLYNKLMNVHLDGAAPQMDPPKEKKGDERRRNGFLSDATNVNPGFENADQPGGIKLDTPQALGIILAAAMTNGVLGFVISRALRHVGVLAGVGSTAVVVAGHLIILPVSLIIIAAMLPTNFRKGMLVSLLYLLCCVILGIGFVAIYFVIAFVSTDLFR